MAHLTPPPRLGKGEGLSLFLDFDGTLVEIASRPQDVVVRPDLPATLRTLAERLEGRLAIVSGRSLAVLDAFLPDVGVAMAGSHGGEFRPAGALKSEGLAAPLPSALREGMAHFARANGELVFEAKPYSTAVHYRDHPEVAADLLSYATHLGKEHGAIIKQGKMVIELTMPGSDKGNAVTHFMQQAPFAGTRPLFAGDDVTDEDAFAAVRPFNGAGILVGAMRPTQALWRLEDVGAMHRWLEEDA